MRRSGDSCTGCCCCCCSEAVVAVVVDAGMTG